MEATMKRQGLAKLKDSVSLFLSIAAIALSLYSLYRSERTHRDVARADVIKTEHDLFNGLALAELENPLMSHLFAVTGDVYDTRSAQVAATASPLDDHAKTRLLLQEGAMSHFIFSTYEETYIIWEHAQQVGDESRASLLREDLDYFNDQLCNRRLLWYWNINNDKGYKLGLLVATRVRKFYEDTVGKNCTEVEDPDGPFVLTAAEAKKRKPLNKSR